jgi:hypothetical protein
MWTNHVTYYAYHAVSDSCCFYPIPSHEFWTSWASLHSFLLVIPENKEFVTSYVPAVVELNYSIS